MVTRGGESGDIDVMLTGTETALDIGPILFAFLGIHTGAAGLLCFFFFLSQQLFARNEMRTL